MAKKIRIFTIIIFCLALLADIAASAALPAKKYSDRENRELAQRPVFSMRSFAKGKYQKKYEKYLDDHFVMRDGWMDVSGMIQAASGRRDVNGVYIGKDGYLIDGADGSGFDKEQLKENAACLSSFLNAASGHYGTENVCCLLIPEKIQVLSGKLPKFADMPDYGEVPEILAEDLAYPGSLIDLGDALANRADEYIYYRTDHHWTTLGAYYACKELMERTGWAVFHPLEYYDREAAFSDFYGTTYNKAHIRTKPDVVELFHSPYDGKVRVSIDGADAGGSLYFRNEAEKTFNRYNVFLSKNTFRIDIDTEAGTGRTLLLIKDSFSNCLAPFLAEYFDKIIMIDYRYGKTPIGDIISGCPGITHVLAAFNVEKFAENTGLEPLSDVYFSEDGNSGADGPANPGVTGSGTMEEFDPESFLESY